MTKVTLISVAFVFLAGCGYYELGGEDMLSLDEALARADTLDDLQFLSEQVHSSAPLGEDEEHYRKIDRKREEFIRKQREQEEYQQEQERDEHELTFKHEYEREFNRQYEQEYELLKSEVTTFIQNNNGFLNNKTAREVRKLVEDWQSFIYKLPSLREKAYSNAFKYAYHENLSLYNPSGWAWQEAEELARTLNKKNDLFSLKNFSKVFGEPQRTQYLSMPYYGNVYCFYYACKDGTVQIQVSASDLDDDGIVIIKELNIF